MNARNALLIGAAAAGSLLMGCGGNHGGQPPVTLQPPPPPPSHTKDLDTAAVLNIVQTTTSETTEPFEVDNAAVALTPAGDETGTPINVVE